MFADLRRKRDDTLSNPEMIAGLMEWELELLNKEIHEQINAYTKWRTGGENETLANIPMKPIHRAAVTITMPTRLPPVITTITINKG